VERKRNFEGDIRVKARQAVCAFANDLPNHNQAGVLFIGVEDNGAPSGVRISDQLLQNLADMKSDGNILPLPVLTVEKRVLDGVELAVVTVMPSDMPPVRYDGRIWIRTGPRRSLANEQEERMLSDRRRYKNQPYDLRPFSNATLNDLSCPFFEDEYLPAAFAPDVLKENHRTYEERLSSLRMIVSVEDPTPTFLGLFTIGKRPLYFLYATYIQFLRIAGTQFGGPVINEAVVSGRLQDMIRMINQTIEVYKTRAYDIVSGPKPIITQDYPEVALQQILYNAILHRNYEETNAPVNVYWYDDRIEIISSGGPYGAVTVENFGTPGIVAYRNPNLAEAMKNLDIIQHFGYGIQLARASLANNGNPPLEFKVDNGFVTCTLRKRL
jgi:ATP-dependent DNA helicase RecG